MAGNQLQLIITAIDKTKEAFQSLAGNFKKLAGDADSFRLKLGEAERWLKNLASTAALYKLGSILKDSIDSTEQMQNALRGLAAITRYAGEDIGQSLSAASNLASDGLIDVQSAAQALQNLLSRGFSLKESIEMLERLKDAAAFNRQAHLSMGEAVKSATEGLKNENSILVDNAGVTKNVSIMWKEYAAEIGKNVEGLTQAEKRQAEYNGIMRETEGQIGNAKLATEGLTGAKAKLSVEIIKLKATLGDSLTPAFVALTGTINWLIDNALKPVLWWFETLGAEAGLIGQKFGAVYDWVKSGFKGGVKGIKEEFKKLDETFFQYIGELAEKWEGKGGIKAPEIGIDTGKRRKDIDIVKNDTKKLGEEWSKVKRDLQTDISKTGLDEFDQKVLEITNKAEDMKQKFKDIPGSISEINAWLQKMTEQVQWEKQWKEYEELQKKREEGEKKYTALVNELETSTADERRNKIQKSIQEETKLTQELLEIWQTTEMSYEEYQNRLTEIEEKGAREREKINEDYNLAILESESRRRLAVLDMAEKEMSLSKTDITKGRIAEYQKLLTYYESIRDRAIELGDITARIQAEDKISDINTQLNELNLTLTELTGTFAEGALRGFNEFLYNLNSTFQTAKEIAKETAQAMEQAFTDFFFDAFDAKLKDLSDYIESFSKSVRRAIASALGQQVSGAIIGGIGKFFGVSAGGVSAGTTGGIWVHKGGMPYEAKPVNIEFVPKFHAGIGPDEVLSIIRKDEGVFTPGQMKALGLMARGASPMNVRVELKNESGTRLEIDENPDIKFDLDQLVISTVVRKVKEDKQFRNFLQTGGKS